MRWCCPWRACPGLPRPAQAQDLPATHQLYESTEAGLPITTDFPDDDNTAIPIYHLGPKGSVFYVVEYRVYNGRLYGRTGYHPCNQLPPDMYNDFWVPLAYKSGGKSGEFLWQS